MRFAVFNYIEALLMVMREVLLFMEAGVEK